MKIQIYILILSLNFECSSQSENSNSREVNVSQNEIEISPKSDPAKNENQIQNLKQLSKVGKFDTYKMTKQKVEVRLNYGVTSPPRNLS